MCSASLLPPMPLPVPPNRNEEPQLTHLRPLLTEPTSDIEPDVDATMKQLLLKPKVMINIEQLLQIENIYADIIQLLKENSFTSLFNRCTDWWDITAPLAALDYEVRVIHISRRCIAVRKQDWSRSAVRSSSCSRW
jgi:hypothetical protein